MEYSEKNIMNVASRSEGFVKTGWVGIFIKDLGLKAYHQATHQRSFFFVSPPRQAAGGSQALSGF